MKKPVLLVTMFVVVNSFCFAQSIYVEKEFASNTGSVDELIEVINHIVNNSAQTVDFRWERIENNFPVEWSVSFCDKNNCYAPFTLTADFTLAPGESGLFKPMFLPNGVEGIGTLKVRVYSLTSGVTFEDTVTYQATTDGFVSVPDPAASPLVEVYPSITNSSVTIFSDLNKVSSYSIIHSTGQMITEPMILYFSANQARINLSYLKSGVYYLLFHSGVGETISTRRIVKL